MKLHFSNIANIKYYQNNLTQVHQILTHESERKLMFDSFSNPVYNMPISFGGLDEKGLKERLSVLEDIHCPCCGIEMLQQDKIDELLKPAKKIETPKEFLDFIKNNKEYISYIFNPLIHNLEMILEKTPDIELLHLLNIARSGSAKHVLNVLGNNVNFLHNIHSTENFSSLDQSLLIECESKLKELLDSGNKLIPAESYINILRTTILKMESENRNKIYNVLRSHASKAFLNRNAMYLTTMENENTSPAYPVLKNMLSLSKPIVRNILKSSSENPLNRYNGILLCGKCYNDGSFYKKMMPVQEENIAKFNIYYQDVAKKIVQGGFDGYERYPFILRKMLKTYPGNINDYVFSEEAFQLKQILFHNTEELNKELPFMEDVPCACCGKDTISHKQKLDLFEEIKNTKSHEELLKILEDKKEIIRPKFQSLVKDYKEKIQEDPLISDEELLKFLRERAAKRLENKIADSLEKAIDFVKKENLSDSDKEKFEEYVRLVKEKYSSIDPEKSFLFVEYNSILDKTVGNMDYDRKHRIIFRMKKPIKKRYVVYQLLFPLPKTLAMFDSPMQLIVQDIFKNSCQTKDHLVAKQKGGTDKRKNLIIMCKDCNRDKTNSSFTDWWHFHPELEENMLKQFEFFAEKIKDGKLDEKFLGYMEELSQTINELSMGRIDLKVNDEDSL